MKVWESNIAKTKNRTNISKNHLARTRRLTTGAIHIPKCLMQNYQENKRDLHMVF